MARRRRQALIDALSESYEEMLEQREKSTDPRESKKLTKEIGETVRELIRNGEDWEWEDSEFGDIAREEKAKLEAKRQKRRRGVKSEMPSELATIEGKRQRGVAQNPVNEEEGMRQAEMRAMRDGTSAPNVQPRPKNKLIPGLQAMLRGTTGASKEREDELKAMRTYKLIDALEDKENTTASKRQAIRRELGSRGVRKGDYGAYRVTGLGDEEREKKIEGLQKSFDLTQEEQTKWQELALTHEDPKMRERYGRWAETHKKTLDEIEETINELKSQRNSK